jgi:hypothetical protein
MSSAGTSGTSDPGKANKPTGEKGATPGGAYAGMHIPGDALDEPVEVIEVMTLEATGDAPEALAGYMPELSGSGFRWWYVPAVALPVAAGVSIAAIALTRRRATAQAQALAEAKYTNALLQWRDLIASRALQGMAATRALAKQFPGTASTWQGKAGGALSSVGATSSSLVQQASDTTQATMNTLTDLWRNRVLATLAALSASSATLAKQASDTSKGTLDTLTGLWQQDSKQPATSAKSIQAQANEWLASLRARRTVAAAASKASTTTASKAAQPASSSAKKTRGKTTAAAKATSKRANSAWRQTRTFTFALLLGALITYFRVWRKRIMEREMRETASGRLEPDTEPQFSSARS